MGAIQPVSLHLKLKTEYMQFMCVGKRTTVWGVKLDGESRRVDEEIIQITLDA